jgi:hypothetical protein
VRKQHPRAAAPRFGDKDQNFVDASLTVQLAANSIGDQTKRADQRVARRPSRDNQLALSGAFADT